MENERLIGLAIMVVAGLCIITSWICSLIRHRIQVKSLKVGDKYIHRVGSPNPFEPIYESTIEVLEIREGWVKYKQVFSDGSMGIYTNRVDCFIIEFGHKKITNN